VDSLRGSLPYHIKLAFVSALIPTDHPFFLFLRANANARAVNVQNVASANKKTKSRGETNPTTSCARLASTGSLFFAMFPLPPRPVV
jgi:hypothetical protein